ncbi:MAG: hydrogenase maturation nickel metallochaperone HypA [Candidatus Hinthialibacter antarcticus]|nr:hydrogenase maturation nickel metallochaperone HypA [Candidatus Hinthialibacter antarcticus]
MYEYSNVERLVSQLNERANGSAHVHEVHLRKGAIFSDEELRKAYNSLTDHTALEGSELVIDQGEFVHYCDDCGLTQTISEEDLVGHLFICPECGGSMKFDETKDLELIEVKFD